MPVNRNALIRYRTIDNCLRNRYRKWTLEDLIEACSDALYEYEGIDKGVSRRTVQMDLQMMRSDKLGYNAPIIIYDRKYYTYEDPAYSITNIPLSNQDLAKLTEVVEILRQFKGFTHFQEISGMLQKLEDKVYVEKTKQQSVIQFETNEHLQGLEILDDVYQAIIKKQALRLTYQSFKARHADTFDFHPQLLKEYRNRWFVLGFKNEKQIPLLLALDRILEVSLSESAYIENTLLNLQEYFHHVIGVSVDEKGTIEQVELFVTHEHAPYLLTKPLHHSQKILKRLPAGIIISLQLQLNFELEKELLGLGETIKVLKPDRLVRCIKKRAAMLHQLYALDLSPIVARETIKKVDRRGSTILEGIYQPQEIHQIIQCITSSAAYSVLSSKNNSEITIRKLLIEIPELKKLLFNQKLCTFIQQGLGEEYFLCKAMYFDKSAPFNNFLTWHQDVTINVQEKKKTTGFSYWTQIQDVVDVKSTEEYLKNIYTIRIHLDKTSAENGALQVMQNSHYHILSDHEVQVLCQRRNPILCEVGAGGIHLMKPLTLRIAPATTCASSASVIQLAFTSMGLPNGLQWSEKELI